MSMPCAITGVLTFFRLIQPFPRLWWNHTKKYMEVSSLGTNVAFSGHGESTLISPQGKKSNKQALLAHLFLQLSDGGCYS